MKTSILFCTENVHENCEDGLLKEINIAFNQKQNIQIYLGKLFFILMLPRKQLVSPTAILH